MSDEIDIIIAIAADPSVWDAGDDDFQSLEWRRRRLAARTVAASIRDALVAKGYRIELDPGALLARGEENVAGGRVK